MNEIYSTDAFEPRELDFLQKFFKSACAERGLNGGSPAAQDLAARIFHLYQRGIREENELQTRLDDHLDS